MCKMIIQNNLFNCFTTITSSFKKNLKTQNVSSCVENFLSDVQAVAEKKKKFSQLHRVCVCVCGPGVPTRIGIFDSTVLVETSVWSL